MKVGKSYLKVGVIKRRIIEKGRIKRGRIIDEGYSKCN